MEPPEFLVHCQLLLEEKNTKELLSILQDDSNNTIADVGWELVSVLCKELTKYEDEEHLLDIEKSLMVLLQRCNPKEVMLGLSEHLATESSLKSFTVTMRLCKLTVVQLKRRQSRYMRTLCKHFSSKMRYLLENSSLDVNSTLNDVEKCSLTDACCNFFSSSIDFLDGILPQIGRAKSLALESYLSEPFCGKSWSSYEISCCRELAIDFIFNVLHVCVDIKIYSMPLLVEYKEIISDFMLCVFKFISFPDFLSYLKQKGSSRCDHVGVLIFFDLLLVQSFGNVELPLVYSCTYWFVLLIPYLNSVLILSNTSVVSIALDLLSWLLLLLNNSCLSPDLLLELQAMAFNLTQIMIWCQEHKLRMLSEELFQSLLKLVNEDSRYLLLCYVYKQSEHPGVHGYLINLIMKSTEALLSSGDSSSEIDIGDLALLFTRIAVGENNVLQESDKYMAALNFVRFWLLKDNRKDNKTGIWNILNKLGKNMSVLSNCISLSKCEFGKQLDQLHRPDENLNDNSFMEMITSLPGGELFHELSHDDKVATVNKALLTLDVMSSVIARIGEITSAKDED